MAAYSFGARRASELIHAAFSLYWAAGGRWLAATLGEWAVRSMNEHPSRTAALLAAFGGAKMIAAAVPVAVEYGVLPRPRLVRALCWVGSVGLIAYGGVYTLTAAAVLAGVITPGDGYDRTAMVGHAALWDPLFLLWGLALASWLSLTRAGPQKALMWTEGRR